MRKNKLNIAGFVLLASLMNACSLNYDPISEYSDVTVGSTDEEGSEIAFKNREEALNQYESIYKRMRDNQEKWYLDYLLFTESYSDNCYGDFSGNAYVVERDWNDYLASIAVANKLICNIDAVPDPGFSQEERNQWKSEALIYRAMNMFDMVRFWGRFPIITQVAPDITSENIEEVYPLYYPQQGTEEEAYIQIEKDLLEGLKYAPENNSSNKTILSKTVARALLAKVYAEKPLRDYQKVIQYADEVAADGIDLVQDFSDLFGMNEAVTDCKARNTKESILEMQYFPGNANWVTWMFGRDVLDWDFYFQWAKWITPSRDLIKAYDKEGDVIRKNETIVYYECGWSNYYPASEYPFMYKCRSQLSNIIKLRYADILLMKAEALIMTDDLPGAYAIINRIRQRAGISDLPVEIVNNKEQMIEALLNERRLELAFEGVRFFDLCRLDKLETVMNEVTRTDTGRHLQQMVYTKDSYKFPIPQSAIDQNPNLTQNPSY
ncbi:RagB/SusD family nutrient uptake outer membrane protein [Phocaeicola plebeius]|uniref:RagB/SusD family nutrient uptake outer membrane protein n=1 Tax=Phocaeicola plebeius TaxID=310297 RepID=UPI0026E97305|nr:RagB/SusD family nutrient uptake outer membrane protein [Phocaeicola plebeius]